MGEGLVIGRRRLLGAGAASFAWPGLRAAPASARPVVAIDTQGGFEDPFDAAARDELRRAGLRAISTTVGQVGNGEDRYHGLLEDVARMRGVVTANPDALRLVTDAADLAGLGADGRTGVILNVQDTSWVSTDLGRLATLQALGLRVVQLTYNVQNLAGDGAVEPADGGLSIFGRRILAEVERLRMVLDLSHGGRRTMAEAATAAKAPPVISHTGCRALADHPRNTDDATMRAVAGKGGFVGIYLMPYLAPGRTVTAADVVAHLDHAVAVCGEEGVGIGTDGAVRTQVADAAYRADMKRVSEARIRDGIAAPGDGPDELLFVPELNGPDKFRMLADRLAAHGWRAARIDKVLGGNAARVFGQVWG